MAAGRAKKTGKVVKSEAKAGPPLAPKDGSVDEIAERVGTSLRALRHARGYSLEDIAALSGVSRATLSQIETNKTNPTIGVLWRISTGLGVPFTALLGGSEPERIIVVRRAMQGVLNSDDGLFQSRPLGPSRLLGHVELYELNLSPKSRHESAAHPPGTVEALYVLSGVIRVGIGSLTRDAGPGDTVFFGADTQHYYENPGRVAARLVNVIVYARAT